MADPVAPSVMHKSDAELSSLDFLRAIAVLLVLANHLLWTLDLDTPFARNLGRLGVYFFFIHTSFVLMMSLDRMRTEAGDNLWSRFMVRRCFRIYPIAIVVLTVVVLGHIPNRLAGGIFHYESVSTATLVANYLLVMNLSRVPLFVVPMWTLAYEMEMYVVLPLLFAIMVRTRSARFWFSAWLLAGALAFARHRLHLPGVTDFLDFVPIFMAGVLAYRVHLSSTRTIPFVVWAVSLFVATLIYAFHPARYVWPIVYAVTCGIGLMAPRVKESRITAVSRASHLIARYSYGIYLVHLMCFWVGFSFFRARAAQFAVSAALIIVIPYILYHAVEAPMIRFGRRLSNAAWRRAPVAVPAEV